MGSCSAATGRSDKRVREALSGRKWCPPNCPHGTSKMADVAELGRTNRRAEEVADVGG